MAHPNAALIDSLAGAFRKSAGDGKYVILRLFSPEAN
jgi:uncharacterized protein (DUF1800 family)